ncbi:MAG: PBSX family phage terminase large subunit [Oscillospiraceae bacterium]|jgi:PBSX family phage terminase large subunit|nr:PBSX family phage terminase large subunit [Oscillospiraceae bacterium]
MKDNKLIFSKKQLLALNWWSEKSQHRTKNAIICDGAIRSGKTFSLSISFFLWAQKHFKKRLFAICGKTIQAATRNVIYPLLPYLSSWGFKIELKESKNYFDLVGMGARNRFYLFGGKDESSAAMIQGITLAGVLFDEVALMPRSFVEQAIARCSVSGSKFWFSCNPQGPRHWFLTEWILKKELKNILYVHFEMADNLTLSEEVKNRYQMLYSGLFYERYIHGRWVASDGLIYSCFEPKIHVLDSLPKFFDRFFISCDYGIVNPASFGLWGSSDSKWFRVEEYYYDSKVKGETRTDIQYYEALEQLAGNRKIEAVIVDPSAASFIETIRKSSRFKVIKAKNDVISGINQVANALKSGELFFSSCCHNSIREFSLYEWNKNRLNDEPIKRNDHAMDEIRYFVATVMNGVKLVTSVAYVAQRFAK